MSTAVKGRDEQLLFLPLRCWHLRIIERGMPPPPLFLLSGPTPYLFWWSRNQVTSATTPHLVNVVGRRDDEKIFKDVLHILFVARIHIQRPGAHGLA
jgi:hypothetical protein